MTWARSGMTIAGGLLLICVAGCVTDPSSAADDASDGGADAGLDARVDGPPAPPELGTCQPTVEEGGACEYNSKCLDPLVCVDDVCRLESIEGEPCDGNSDCIDGLVCPRYDLEGRRLASRTCQAIGALGEGCWSRNTGTCGRERACLDSMCSPKSENGGPCRVSSDCASSDLYCQKADGEDFGICADDLGPGGDCSADRFACQRDLTCVSGQCIPDDEAERPGAACERNIDCASRQYCDRYDDATGTLRAAGECRPEYAEGEACDVAEEDSCFLSRCVNGLCVDDVAEGGACISDLDCDDGLQCARE